MKKYLTLVAVFATLFAVISTAEKSDAVSRGFTAFFYEQESGAGVAATDDVVCGADYARTAEPVTDGDFKAGGQYALAEENVNYISSVSDWNELASSVESGDSRAGEKFILTCDLQGDIKPVGSKKAPFAGIIDGGGHVLVCDISGGDYVAPVGYLARGGAVLSLGVHGDMSGNQAVGGVVGFNDRGSVENCYHSGDVTADNYGGGVVGENRGTIASCYAVGNVKVEGEARFAGGITATNDYDGSISDCYFAGQVNCTGRGGIVGYAGRGTVRNCAYLKDKCDRGYSEAGNTTLESLEGLDIAEMTGGYAPCGDYVTRDVGGEDWGCLPALRAFDGYGRNTYLNWPDHLVTEDLLVLVRMDGASVYPLRGETVLEDDEKKGYLFSGWYSAPQGGNKVEVARSGSDVCLYGRYEIITYTVTYDLGGGIFADGFAPVVTYTVKDSLVLPGAENVLLSGNVFRGWRTADGQDISEIPAGSVGDITLTAVFEPTFITKAQQTGEKYFWVIVDVALAVIIVAEAAVVARVRKKRKYAVYAFAPFSPGFFFFPAGVFIAAAELAVIFILPLTLIRRRETAGAQALATCDDLFIDLTPERRLLLETSFFPPAETEENEQYYFRRNSYTARLVMSSEKTKELYKTFKAYIMSFGGVKSRVSWSGETFHAGRITLAKAAVTGNTLKLYFALDDSELDGRFRVLDKRGVKRYELTPLMLKVRSRRALKRAMELADKTCARAGITQKGNADDIVIECPDMSREQLQEQGYIRTFQGKRDIPGKGKVSGGGL